MFLSLSVFARRLRLPSGITILALLFSLFFLTQSTKAKKFSDDDSMDFGVKEREEDVTRSESESIDTNRSILSDRILNSSKMSKKCKVDGNEALKMVMENVCQLCHDFYSHQKPNMRSECRLSCFRNTQFKKCLQLFRPHRSLRHSMHRRHTSIFND